ncbi:MAG: hypothetical protein U9P14_12425, partial [Gemmatimonadota bacterium]|nr:hypothetical protein [Gemmatimonadota bacterium]
LLFAIEKELDSQRAASYYPGIVMMLERIQEVAVDSGCGLMFNEVDVRTGEVTRDRFSDNWGYNYDAYYAFYMATGEEKYRDLTLRVLENIHRYRNYNWEPRESSKNGYGADGYADAIEGALGLLSHLPVESAFDWVETETARFLAMQRRDGIIEGWHGDGNFARTALMYAFYKTKGAYCTPWNKDLFLAAEENSAGDLEVYLHSKKAWSGRLCFDPPRHKVFLGMSADYPRINAFPEWFTAEPLEVYLVKRDGSASGGKVMGSGLISGFELKLQAGETIRLKIRQL